MPISTSICLSLTLWLCHLHSDLETLSKSGQSFQLPDRARILLKYKYYNNSRTWDTWNFYHDSLEKNNLGLQCSNNAKKCGWNGKQCWPWSDCSFKSSLILVRTVCSDLSVPILRIFMAWLRKLCLQSRAQAPCFKWLINNPFLPPAINNFHPITKHFIIAYSPKFWSYSSNLLPLDRFRMMVLCSKRSFHERQCLTWGIFDLSALIYFHSTPSRLSFMCEKISGVKSNMATDIKIIYQGTTIAFWIFVTLCTIFSFQISCRKGKSRRLC